ncbi:MAG: tetratricopeptide repeat protein [Alphaproteobacteria bacterium]|nr:tetratricopeptide repeat protein [Alphaproteobacteria bacterium]
MFQRNVSLPAAIALSLLVGIGPADVRAATTGPEGVPGFQPDRVVEGFERGSTVAGRFLAARHAEAVGDLVAAADLTAGIISDVPDYGTIRRRAHLLMVGAGRLEKASELAEDVLASNETDPLAIYTLYVAALRDDRFEDAAALLVDVPDSGVNAILVPLLDAWAQAGAGRHGEAFDGLAELADSQGLGPITGLHQALIADLGGDAVRADAAFARALEASGGQPSLQLVDSFTRFLMREGREEEAASLLGKFSAQNPDTLLIEPIRDVVEGDASPARSIANPLDGAAEVFRNVSGLLNRERLRTEALMFVRLSLGLDPDNPTALFSLGQLLAARERSDLAIETYREIGDDTPYHWYARLSIADALHTEEQADAAIEILEAMVQERTERSDAVRALADVLRIEKRFEEAIEVYDLAFEREGDAADWRLLYTRGIALERAKQWERAERDFLKALELEPDQPLVLNYLGYSWVEQGEQLERAKEMIETAVARRPNDGYITDSLGWVLYRLGDFEGAVVHLERAVLLEPGDPVINDHLGDAYWLVGRKLEARFQWERALTLDPDPEVEAEIRKKLAGEKFPEPQPPGTNRDI